MHDYEPSQQRGDAMSENWHNPNKPKLKNIKDEDVAYELRELSKYTSLTPEIINIICHGYARICQLERERDEARRECRLLLLGQDVLRGVRDLPAPPDDLVTIVPVPRKEDGNVR